MANEQEIQLYEGEEMYSTTSTPSKQSIIVNTIFDHQDKSSTNSSPTSCTTTNSSTIVDNNKEAEEQQIVHLSLSPPQKTLVSAYETTPLTPTRNAILRKRRRHNSAISVNISSGHMSNNSSCNGTIIDGMNIQSPRNNNVIDDSLVHRRYDHWNTATTPNPISPFHKKLTLTSPRRYSDASEIPFGTSLTGGKSASAASSFHTKRFNQYTFHAERITKGDHFLRGYDRKVGVCVDVTRRRLVISVPYSTSSFWRTNDAPANNKNQTRNNNEIRKTLYYHSDDDDIEDEGDYNSDSSSDSTNSDDTAPADELIVIDWDNISGIDFQYSPQAPAIVILELFNAPTKCPKHFSSVVYFLYCSKQDCATYLDDIMLRHDERLFKLAIQSLPTWSVIVNRYSLPIYYSYRIRQLITTLVNIYIVFSLVWGFYDLYKNLPFVGGALRRIFGPLVLWFEPLWSNRVVLLVPLLLNRLFGILNKIFYMLLPLIQSMGGVFVIFKSLILSPLLAIGEHIIVLLHFILYPLIMLLSWLQSGVVSSIMGIYAFMYPFILFFTWLFTGAFEMVKFVGLFVYTIIKLPIQLIAMIWDLVGAFTIGIYEFGSWIWHSQLQALSVLFYGSVELLKATFNVLLYYPFDKIRLLFSYKREIDKARQTVVHISGAIGQMSSAGANLDGITNTHDIKQYFDLVKENVKPVSYIWTGFRRIVDSIIYTYHTKIKHHSTWVKRILITFLLLVITVAFILTFMIVL